MTFENVRSLQRGLVLLQAINRRDGMKAGEIAKVTAVPRPTVYRLLESLEAMRFVARDHSSHKWRVTLHAKTLSSGFREQDWIMQLAVPKMVKLSREILWPIDLVVHRNYRMQIRESTHNISPYSIDHGMVGVEMPVLDTSSGRAYLAFSPEKERRHTLAGLRAELSLTDPILLADGPLDKLLADARELGVGFRLEGYRTGTQSISAPIFHDGRVVACATIIWIASALKFEKAVETLRDKLVATAGAIAASLPVSLDSEIKELQVDA